MSLKILTRTSMEGTKSFLNDCHIPMQEWGKGKTKSLEELVESLNTEEVVMYSDSGLVHLRMKVAAIHVRYDQEVLIKAPQGPKVTQVEFRGQKPIEVYEAYHLFEDGEKLVRTFDGSVGEKQLKGQEPYDAAVDGLKQELGFDDPSRYSLCKMNFEIMRPMPSSFWPGVHETYDRSVYICRISPDLYKPEYIEYKNGARKRTIHFLWKDYVPALPALAAAS